MNRQPNDIEVEVKFFLEQPEKMHRSLINLDATVQPKIFERNLRFEDSNGTLKNNGKLLRLRQDKRCRLTYKCQPDHIDLEYKVLNELEVTVSDFDTMREILYRLGFHSVQIYEKWRQTFYWNKVKLCMDTMPYGSFLEIEGSKEGIKQAADELHLAWEKRILKNYLEIFEVLRTHNNLLFYDVTFANFENISLNIIPFLKTFEAGM